MKRLLPLILLLLSLPAAAQWLGPTYKHINNTQTNPDTPYVMANTVNAALDDIATTLRATITGCLSIPGGTNTSQIGANCLNNGNFAFMPPLTTKCNPASAPGPMQDCSVSVMQFLLGVNTGAGSSGPTVVSLTAPAEFTVSGSPSAALGFAWAPENANTVLAGPATGTSGTPGFRALVSKDIPLLTGDVTTNAAGVSAITTNVIVNSDFSNSPPLTLKGNNSATAGALQDLTVAQVNAMLGTGSGGSGAGSGTPLTNQVDFCTMSGVDATGATDSLAALVTAFASVAGTNKELEINCPVKLTIGTDATKPIFVQTGTNIRMGPSGVFITDNNFLPAFVFNVNAGSTWSNVNIQYVGALVPKIDVAPFNTLYGTFNDGRLKADLGTYGHNTFSNGGSSYSPGFSNHLAQITITGASSHLNFINLHIFTDPSRTASQFVPECVSVDPQWIPGTNVVTNNNPVNSTYAQGAKDINFINPVFDGYYMGFTGSGGEVNITGARFRRYSDLQDDSYLTNTVGANQGGTNHNNWFAPPHAIYMSNGDSSLGGRYHITNTIDYGQYVGGTQRRAPLGLVSLKMDLDGGNDIDDYISYRPDGFMATLRFVPPSGKGAHLKNVYAVFDTSIAAWDGSTYAGWAFQEPYPLQNVVISNATLVDTAAVPSQWPISGSSIVGNQDISITDLKIFVNNLPAAATYAASPTWQGTNIRYDAEYHFTNFDQTGTNKILIFNNGAAYCVNCDFSVKVFGWRQPTVTFATAPASGATTATLAANWPYLSGTYSVQFSDQELRYAQFTNGSTTVGSWGTGLTAAVSAVATGGNMLTANFDAYKPYIKVNINGGSVYTRAHIIDVSNGYEAIQEDGVLTESWAQSYQGPVSGTTATGFTTPISYPNTFAIDRSGYAINSSLASGPTGINIGWTGNDTALVSNGAISGGTNPIHNIGFYPIALPSNPTAVVVKPIGASFGTGGVLSVTTRATQVRAGQ